MYLLRRFVALNVANFMCDKVCFAKAFHGCLGFIYLQRRSVTFGGPGALLVWGPLSLLLPLSPDWGSGGDIFFENQNARTCI